MHPHQQAGHPSHQHPQQQAQPGPYPAFPSGPHQGYAPQGSHPGEMQHMMAPAPHQHQQMMGEHQHMMYQMPPNLKVEHH
jgi:hypothetical protein